MVAEEYYQRAGPVKGCWELPKHKERKIAKGIRIEINIGEWPADSQVQML